MQDSRPGHSSGYGQGCPQHNVFKNRNAQDEAGKSYMQNLQIGKDLGNYWNGGDGHADRQNDDERKLISPRACDCGSNQHGAEH
jgi:hypothetical protein